MKVLIADDDISIRAFLAGYLEMWGFESVEVDSGDKALAALLADDPPRIAILDWIMPGLTGVEVCEALNNSRKSFIYLLLLTSKSEKTDLTHALDSGAHQFLSKPIEPDILKSMLNLARRMVETDEALVRVERLAAAGSLACGMAHQFNNLVSGVMAYVDFVLSDKDLADKHRTQLDKVDNLCRRMGDILRMSLDFARYDEPELSMTSLIDIVDDALSMEYDEISKANIRVACDYATIPMLLLDKRGIQQVILHLLINAYHALGDTSKPRIEISTGFSGNNKIFFRIKDNGCGIPAKHLRDIFSPFFSLKGEHSLSNNCLTRVRGIGLGLSVAEGIVRKNGGSILAESIEGEGSTFTVFLPNPDSK